MAATTQREAPADDAPPFCTSCNATDRGRWPTHRHFKAAWPIFILSAKLTTTSVAIDFASSPTKKKKSLPAHSLSLLCYGSVYRLRVQQTSVHWQHEVNTEWWKSSTPSPQSVLKLLSMLGVGVGELPCLAHPPAIVNTHPGTKLYNYLRSTLSLKQILLKSGEETKAERLGSFNSVSCFVIYVPHFKYTA